MKILVDIHHDLLDKVMYIAKAENRTRSDLVREALRRYVRDFKMEIPDGYHPGNIINKNTGKRSYQGGAPRMTQTAQAKRDRTIYEEWRKTDGSHKALTKIGKIFGLSRNGTLRVVRRMSAMPGNEPYEAGAAHRDHRRSSSKEVRGHRGGK